MQGHP